MYVDETSGVGEEAVLAGAHCLWGTEPTSSVAIGGGRSVGTACLVHSNARGMFDSAAQLNLNYHLVGVGFEAMAGVGASRRYMATGASFSLGWFR